MNTHHVTTVEVISPEPETPFTTLAVLRVLAGRLDPEHPQYRHRKTGEVWELREMDFTHDAGVVPPPIVRLKPPHPGAALYAGDLLDGSHGGDVDAVDRSLLHPAP